MFKVSIVGMPNVGKSTLFNAIIGKKFAITHNSPGITRDYKLAECNFLGLEFELIDTAGWEFVGDDINNKELSSAMKEQTKAAIQKSDLILLVFDSTRHITGYEEELVKYIRETLNNNLENCIVLLNKCDREGIIDINQIYKLGFSGYISVSASNKLGFDELYHSLKLAFENLSFSIDQKDGIDTLPDGGDTSIAEDIDMKSISVAIVGRPNAGKSTIFNGILREKRAIVSAVSGTTRDSINHTINYNSREIEFIDTAGLRKKKKIKDEIESYSAVGSITSIRRANIAILVLDAILGIDAQELKIAGIAQNEGKPLIVILNKVDLLKNKRESIKGLISDIREKLSDSKEFYLLYKSAIRDKHYDDLLAKVIDLYDNWSMHIKTAKLNNWLVNAQAEHTPPLSSNARQIKLKYITQCAVKPPSFKVFCNYPRQLPGSYVRYLKNNMIKHFKLEGIPLRIEVIKSKNPYD